jgi:hypothetical protein
MSHLTIDIALLLGVLNIPDIPVGEQRRRADYQ